VESINSTVHTAVLLLLHSVYHCDVFWHLHVAIFVQFLSEVMRQPMLKAATQLGVVLRFKMSVAIHLLLLYASMVWCLLDHRSNTSPSAVCHHGVVFTGPQEQYISFCCMPSWCGVYWTTGATLPLTFLYIHISYFAASHWHVSVASS